MTPAALRWSGDAAGSLELLDQTLLPGRVNWIACRNVPIVVEAIRSLRVRGAPAIGIAGGYGTVLAAAEATRLALSPATALAHVRARAAELASARPTAVNLRWAVARCLRALDALPAGAAITTAWDQGRRFEVFADETRPLLQGARLTAWELVQGGIPVTVLCDGAAAALLASGRVGSCIVGADRIAANGDAANKIGTYGLALAAAAHGIPFFVAAPSSTFDLALATGAGIPIEERAADEVLAPLGVPAAPAGARAYNPAFDVTPARLIRGLITEHGLISPVTAAEIRKVLGP